MTTTNKDIGIYVHIPFCTTRCYYCDFFSSVMNGERMEKYVEAVANELKNAANECRDFCVKTIYYGGGTPSLLTEKQLERLQKSIYDNFHVNAVETTIEINPNSSEKLGFYKSIGIDRVSVGVQSLDDGILKKIGRRHDKKQALDCLNRCDDLFDNVSADLILGIEEKQDVISDVRELSKYVKHLSCYMLKVEKGTVLEKQINQNKVTVATEDAVVNQYNDMLCACEKVGLMRYETSNFALKGYESRHNSAYWDLTPYIGAGAGAHGYVNGKRYYNEENIDEYIRHVNIGETTKITEREYSLQDEKEEYIMLGLRTSKGIDIDKFNKKFGMDFLDLYSDKLKKAAQYIVVDKDNVYIKPQYFLVQNSIISLLL